MPRASQPAYAKFRKEYYKLFCIYIIWICIIPIEVQFNGWFDG